MSDWIVRTDLLGVHPGGYAALMDDDLREELSSLRDWEADLVECNSPDGWSLHEPDSTDEQIASGAAPFLICGGDAGETDAPRIAREQAAELAFLLAYRRAHEERFGEPFAGG